MHHNGKPHAITRRRETAKVRRERLEAEAREREREADARALHAVDGLDDMPESQWRELHLNNWKVTK